MGRLPTVDPLDILVDAAGTIVFDAKDPAWRHSFGEMAVGVAVASGRPHGATLRALADQLYLGKRRSLHAVSSALLTAMTRARAGAAGTIASLIASGA